MKTANLSVPSGRFGDESGVTLIELLVVCVIIAIVAGIALMQRGSANEQFQRQNVAQGLKVAFERARFDSVKRRAVCDADKARVIVNETSFELWTDKDLNRTPDASESDTTSFAGQNIVLGGVSLTLPVTVLFNQRGEVKAIDSTTAESVNPEFLICNITCSETLTNANANKVFVTPTGTVNLISGGENQPTFGAPGGSTIGTSLEINDNMVLTSTGGC